MRRVFCGMILWVGLWASDEVSHPFPAVTLIRRTTGKPLRIYLVKIDLQSPRTRFETVMAHDQVYGAQERTSAMAQRRNADLAVNADYFGPNHHNCEELFYTAGRRIYAPPTPFRSILNLTRENEVHIGMDRDGLRFYSTVGGGPHFIRNGAFQWDQSVTGLINGEGFTPNTVFDAATNPWTAVGFDAARSTLVLAVVDGRQPSWSAGVGPREMGDILLAEGVAEAMRFDGGGSSTLWVRDQGVVNRPSDGTERPVGTGLLLFVDSRPYFMRGDANGDGGFDISDPIAVLLYLFAGRSVPCEKAADADDSGRVDIADPIGLLGWLFQSGLSPRAPFPGCGPDATADSLACTRQPAFCP